MTRCAFCHAEVMHRRPDGNREALCVIVMYLDRPYHAVPCWEKVKRVAERTGGVL